MAYNPEGHVLRFGHTLHVSCGGGAAMTVPAIQNEDGSLGWQLTYNEPSRANNMAAASAIESYAHLIDHCTREEAWRRIKLLRKARQDHAS